MSLIEKNIIAAVQKAVKNLFSDIAKKDLPAVYLEIPKEKKFGDFSTNVAMRLARLLKASPLDIAGKLSGEIKRLAGDPALKAAIEDIKVEKPGFINFYISNETVMDSLKEIIGQRDEFGRLSSGKGKKIQIEFVSANPTGPLTVAHGRQAAVGDSLARIFQFCGYKVTREYYINDEGVQMDLLGKSVKARAMEMIGRESGFPEDGYRGDYIYEIAKEMLQVSPQIKKEELPDSFFADYAYRRIMETIEKDLKDFDVTFEVWYSQRKLSRSGKIKKALAILREKGFLYDKDGAVWFRSTDFGDDKDRVAVKNDGNLTYLAPDIAYHKDKYERGFDRIINIWGPDHHGYVNRISAAWQALGFDKNALSVLICQLVTLYRDKKPVRMSTRGGEFVMLREVIDEVGKDAGRFFFMMRRTDSHLDFDLELAKSKSMDNPVYYIQYAHARIASVIKFSGDVKPDLKDLHLLNKPEEINIIKALMQYPKIIEASARNLEPYVLLSYLQDLANLFHSYYDAYRIVTEDAALTRARVALIMALKRVFFSGLTLLGVSAPEKM